MILNKKIAVIYGAAGSIGSVISRSFAREGAIVHLAGRTFEKVEKLANEIIREGGKAIPAEVDAMNEKEVNLHMDEILRSYGHLDISFNLIEIENKQNIALTEMTPTDFVFPIEKTMHTQFITCTAAGRAMKKNNSGVILTLTATPGGVGYPMVGGFGPACSALENFSRSLAVELGQFGIRVINIRSAGSPDSRPFLQALSAQPEMAKAVILNLKSDTMLKDLPLVNDIAGIVLFMASDLASKITGVTIDATVGTTEGLNYRTTK